MSSFISFFIMGGFVESPCACFHLCMLGMYGAENLFINSQVSKLRKARSEPDMDHKILEFEPDVMT